MWLDHGATGKKGQMFCDIEAKFNILFKFNPIIVDDNLNAPNTKQGTLSNAFFIALKFSNSAVRSLTRLDLVFLPLSLEKNAFMKILLRNGRRAINVECIVFFLRKHIFFEKQQQKKKFRLCLPRTIIITDTGP